jgi:hypothetical protein
MVCFHRSCPCPVPFDFSLILNDWFPSASYRFVDRPHPHLVSACVVFAAMSSLIPVSAFARPFAVSSRFFLLLCGDSEQWARLCFCEQRQ